MGTQKCSSLLLIEILPRRPLTVATGPSFSSKLLCNSWNQFLVGIRVEVSVFRPLGPVCLVHHYNAFMLLVTLAYLSALKDPWPSASVSSNHFREFSWSLASLRPSLALASFATISLPSQLSHRHLHFPLCAGHSCQEPRAAIRHSAASMGIKIYSRFG